MATKKYTVPIDKELCRQFLVNDISTLTEAHITEVRKVFNVVVRNHYADMKYDDEELFQENLVKTLEDRAKYDPKFCAYNYIYTGMRYRIGNEKVTRRKTNLIGEEVLPDKEYVSWERTEEEDELVEILSGTNEVTELRPEVAFNLLFGKRVAENVAVEFSKLITGVSRSVQPVSDVSGYVQILRYRGSKFRRVVINGNRFYVVKDLWPSLTNDNQFTIKKKVIPCISERGLTLAILQERVPAHTALVQKLFLY
jgi:hypothetical protein